MPEAIERAARAYCEAAYGPGMADLYQKMGDIRWQEAIASVPAVLESLLPPSEEVAEATARAIDPAIWVSIDSGKTEVAIEKWKWRKEQELKIARRVFTAAILCALGRAE